MSTIDIHTEIMKEYRIKIKEAQKEAQKEYDIKIKETQKEYDIIFEQKRSAIFHYFAKQLRLRKTNEIR